MCVSFKQSSSKQMSGRTIFGEHLCNRKVMQSVKGMTVLLRSKIKESEAGFLVTCAQNVSGNDLKLCGRIRRTRERIAREKVLIAEIFRYRQFRSYFTNLKKEISSKGKNLVVYKSFSSFHRGIKRPGKCKSTKRSMVL